jgi:AcrR family transcriptional regulator
VRSGTTGIRVIPQPRPVRATSRPAKRTPSRVGQLRGPETKSALLDRAERLFATNGFNATSVRAITTAARANLGAVNYHFGSKNDLIVAVLRRRIRPLNDQRISMLRQFEARSKALSIEAILEALFRPPLRLVAQADEAGQFFVRLIAHCFADTGAVLRPLIAEELSDRNRQFHAAIKRALPYLSRNEIQWRLHFADGVFLHTIANAHVLEIASGGRCRLGNIETILERMIAFCAAGFAARGATRKK